MRKLKISLICTFAALLCCALFVFLGVNAGNATQKNLNTDTESLTEITAPEKEATATALVAGYMIPEWSVFTVDGDYDTFDERFGGGIYYTSLYTYSNTITIPTGFHQSVQCWDPFDSSWGLTVSWSSDIAISNSDSNTVIDISKLKKGDYAYIDFELPEDGYWDEYSDPDNTPDATDTITLWIYKCEKVSVDSPFSSTGIYTTSAVQYIDVNTYSSNNTAQYANFSVPSGWSYNSSTKKITVPANVKTGRYSITVSLKNVGDVRSSYTYIKWKNPDNSNRPQDDKTCYVDVYERYDDPILTTTSIPYSTQERIVKVLNVYHDVVTYGDLPGGFEIDFDYDNNCDILTVRGGTAPGKYMLDYYSLGNYKFKDGSDTMWFELTITKLDQTPTISGSDKVVYGSTLALTGTGRGALSWKSSDTSIATVDSNGVLTPVKAGTVTITLTAAGNSVYNSATVTKTITVQRKAIAVPTLSVGSGVDGGATASNQTATTTYNGSAQHFTLSAAPSEVTFGTVTGLTRNGTDISVTDANTYAVSMKIDGDKYCWGSTNGGTDVANKSLSIKVETRNILNATFGTIDAFSYDGTKKEPTPTITDISISKTLVNNTDFTFSYSNNINVGTATITITGKGNYTGTKSATFAINGLDINGATVGALDSFIYDGTEKKPTATVTYGNITLVSGSDFEFSYSSNINAGTGKLIITGKGNYSGTKEVAFTISARNLSNATIADIPSQEYNGTAKTPALTLTDGSATLVIGTDYTVEFTNNINAGTATVTITGIGNYTGERTRTFTITARSISNAAVPAIPNEVYDGVAKEPTITATDLSKTLTEGVDYDVTYANNVNAGQASVILTGKGNYTGTKTVYFTIDNAGLSSATVTLGVTSVVYDGTAQEPTVTVRLGSDLLVNGTDYTVTYKNNTNVGTASVIITGKGDYSGSKTVTFEITAADISDATVTGVDSSYPYTGSAIEPAITVTLGSANLIKDTDYTVSYSNNTVLGTATITITGTGNYTGTKIVTFKIVAAEITNATIGNINASYVYTGSAIEPEITVTFGGATLVKDTDYTVSYSANTEVGTATITVTGKGDYFGTVTKTFEIVAADINNATIEGINTEYVYTGSAIEPEITVTIGSVTLIKDTDYTVSYDNNTLLGTATVTVTGTGNYTGTESVTFEIIASDIKNATITGVDASYGYTGNAIEPIITVTLGDVTLVKDSDYTVSYGNNTNIGTATVTITGNGNFTGTKTVSFEIVAGDISDIVITGIDAEYEYTGSEIEPVPTVTLNGVVLVKDTHYTLTYSSNTALGTATITVNGTGSYSGSKMVAFAIVAADIANATVTGIGVSYGYTGSAIEPLPTVTLNGITLVKDTDYTVSFTDNIDVGVAGVKIEGTGNYKGVQSLTFRITKSSLTVTISYDTTKTLYVGKALPEITSWTATCGGVEVEGVAEWQKTELELGEISYVWVFTPNDTDNFDVYYGSETLTSIEPSIDYIEIAWKEGMLIPDIYVTTTLDQLRNYITVSGMLTDGDALGEVVGYQLQGVGWALDQQTPTAAGTYNVIAMYRGKVVQTPLSVVYKLVSYVEITATDSTKTYYGLDKFDKTGITVTALRNDGHREVITDYDIIYQDNRNELWADDTQIIISYKGNGANAPALTCVVAVTVIRQDMNLDGVDVPETVTESYDGASKAYRIENLPDGVTVTYKYEKKIGENYKLCAAEDLTDAGEYRITAEFGLDGDDYSHNYNPIPAKTVTFVINKATPKIDQPTVDGKLTVGTKLGSLTLTGATGDISGTFTWDNAEQELQAGMNRYAYTFTPDDTNNYETVKSYIELSVGTVSDGEAPSSGSSTGIPVWGVVGSIVAVVVAIIALIVAVKKPKTENADSDGFYDDATEDDLKG